MREFSPSCRRSTAVSANAFHSPEVVLLTAELDKNAGCIGYREVSNLHAVPSAVTYTAERFENTGVTKAVLATRTRAAVRRAEHRMGAFRSALSQADQTSAANSVARPRSLRSLPHLFETSTTLHEAVRRLRKILSSSMRAGSVRCGADGGVSMGMSGAMPVLPADVIPFEDTPSSRTSMQADDSPRGYG